METGELIKLIDEKFGAPLAELHTKVDKTASDTVEMELRLTSALTVEIERVETESRKELDNLNNYFKQLSPDATSAEEAQQQKAFSNFVRYGVKGDGLKTEAALPDEVRSLTEGVATAGGVLVPDTMSDKIIELAVDLDPVYSLASKATVSGNSWRGPVETTDPTPAYTGEGSSGSESAAVLAEKIIHIHGIKFYTQISDELTEDTDFDIEAFCTRRAAIKVAELGGQDFVNGTGVTQPEGIITNATVLASAITGKSAATDVLTWKDLFYALLTLNERYQANATHIMRGVTLARLLVEDSGNTPLFTIINTIAGNRMTAIRTSPTVAAEANAAHPLITGDFAQGYLIVEKANRFKVLRDPFSNAGYVTLRFVWRVGGGVIDTAAFVPTIV